MGTKKGIVLGLLLAVSAFAGPANSEPSYLVYPSSPAVFRYDSSRYELVSSGDTRFDPAYSVGGQMLWDFVESRIPIEFYRAPVITGFDVSPTGTNEYVTIGNDFQVIIDGFGTTPRTLGNLCLRFWPQPSSGLLQVFVDGMLATSAATSLAPVEVQTNIGSGFYADTGVHSVTWIGATAIEIIAFSDKDGDRSFGGSVTYRIVATDNVVGVEAKTWGGLKAMYRD